MHLGTPSSIRPQAPCASVHWATLSSCQLHPPAWAVSPQTPGSISKLVVSPAVPFHKACPPKCVLGWVLLSTAPSRSPSCLWPHISAEPWRTHPRDTEGWLSANTAGKGPSPWASLLLLIHVCKHAPQNWPSGLTGLREVVTTFDQEREVWRRVSLSGRAAVPQGRNDCRASQHWTREERTDFQNQLRPVSTEPRGLLSMAPP